MKKKWKKFYVKKTSDVSSLVTTTVLNTKICKVKWKISDVSGLVATTILNIKIEGVGNRSQKLKKDTSVSDLFKMTDYNAKISDNGTKHFGTSDYNNFTSELIEMKIKKD